MPMPDVGPLPGQPKFPGAMPSGYRLAKIFQIRETIEELHRIEQEDKKGLGETTTNWMNRAGKAERKREQQAGTGIQQKMIDFATEIIAWLPSAVSAEAMWTDPLDPEELAELFSAFVPKSGEQMRPAILTAFQEALPHADLNATVAIMEGMLLGNLQYAQAWQVLGESGMRRCSTASDVAISGFAWALATAYDKLDTESFGALKVGMTVGLAPVPKARLKVLRWSCAELGVHIPEVMGTAPFRADPAAAQHAWSAVARLIAIPGAVMLRGEPLPMVLVPKVISTDDAEALIALAEKDQLWRPSARKAGGGSDAGTPVQGRPWSALLESPHHLLHPVVRFLRLWVADAFDVPLEHVEALRLVRYREGEQSGPPHADARPPGDGSLWLHGQRTAAVLIHLRGLPVAAGGDTVFERLDDLRVPPVSGTALVWPLVNVSGFPEPRAARAAGPVLGKEAIKYTVVTWVRSQPMLELSAVR